ncbi:MAG: ECF transporter S component [Ruminococcaceae bacterium]|nr:ECF transporter S component [Oscillospiraceae bacterium]
MSRENRMDMKKVTVSALLTAMAIIIPNYMPKLVLEPIFSATFAAHVPGIVALFLGPAAVIGTAIGSALGFFMSLANPWVSARALLHLVFGLVGYYMAKERYNIFLLLLVTGIIHAASEMLVGLVSLPFIAAPPSIVNYILVTVGLGTFIHHCIDFAIVLLIYTPLYKAKVLPIPLNYNSLKK